MKFILMLLPLLLAGARAGARCDDTLLSLRPREIDPARSFDALVDWIHDDLIVRRGAPGFVIGVSGKDSILTFLAAARAFERAGLPERVVGIHFGRPLNAEVEAARPDQWFQSEVMPWLERQAPGARLLVDGSIDHTRDGLRWGALLEWSVERPGDRYWVLGTRNRTEDRLGTYSNASLAVSAQPLQDIWNSEALQICQHLDVPRAVLARSCDRDCACGRQQLPAVHIPEVDALLMAREGLVTNDVIDAMIPARLRAQLEAYVEEQIAGAQFKREIPYVPSVAVAQVRPNDDQTIDAVKADLATGAMVRALTRLVPRVIAEDRPDRAAELVTAPSADRAAWTPEALALFAVPSLRTSHRARMVESVFGAHDLSVPDLLRLTRASGRLGALGFSFGTWRFLAMRSGNRPALLEGFGFERLVRPNDDRLGAGFRRQNAEWTVELRRAYLVVARRAGDLTLVVRNSAHHYGRDLLPAPAYVAFEPIGEADLRALDADRLALDPRFVSWTELLARPSEIDLTERVRRTELALNHLDELDRSVSEWLRRPEGLGPLIEVMRGLIARGDIAHLGLRAGPPPAWRPLASWAVTPALVDELERRQFTTLLIGTPANARLALMSGPDGDLP